MYWLDSSELAAGAWTLGVAHPPGHPLAMLVGKACALVPVGPVALKVGLASALCGAGAAARTAQLGALVARRARGDRRQIPVDELLGATAGVAFALSWAAAFQAVRAEVYALHALLVLSAAVELLRFDETGDRRRLYLAAVWAGLALTNHSLLALAFLAAALPFAVLRRPQAAVGGAVVRVAAAGALGAILIAYLPLRAARHPLVNWGAGHVFWTVSAQAFQKSVERGQVGDAADVVWALAAELHVVGLLLALGGAYVLARLPRTRRLALFLVGAAVLDALMPALVGFDPVNPDAFGYLEPAVALLLVCACAFPAALTARAPAIVPGALLVALAAFFGRGFDLSRERAAEATIGRFLDGAPSRAPLVTSYFQTVFGVWYLRAVEGRRPDVPIVHRHFLAYPGYRDELLRREPETAPLIGERDVDAAALARVGALVEYDVDLDERLVARARTVEPPPSQSQDPQARRFAGWQAFLAAHRACRFGDAAEFARRLADARARLGADPELAKLADRCRQKLRSPSPP
jgi:hypothetical protein